MAGIYGGSMYDRARESELDKWLDSYEDDDENDYDPEDYWDDDL